jgi:hypothetical protein
MARRTVPLRNRLPRQNPQIFDTPLLPGGPPAYQRGDCADGMGLVMPDGPIPLA